MDAAAEALAYDRMDLDPVNRAFVSDLLDALDPGRPPSAADPMAAGEEPIRILDLGTGTARIAALLCHAQPKVRILAVDLSAEMLDLARIHIELEGLTSAIRLDRQDAKQLQLPDNGFQATISNSLIHHLADPLPALREAVRVVQPGGLVFMRDLRRPMDMNELDELLDRHAGQEQPAGRDLFRQSLLAALTVQEMQQLVESLGYNPHHVRRTSDRHWTWVHRKA
jgi:ubiquinone/menaquinone biosynthesis C-methylase UbiE